MISVHIVHFDAAHFKADVLIFNFLKKHSPLSLRDQCTSA